MRHRVSDEADIAHWESVDALRRDLTSLAAATSEQSEQLAALRDRNHSGEASIAAQRQLAETRAEVVDMRQRLHVSVMRVFEVGVGN